MANLLIITREAGHTGSYYLGELLAARGAAVLFEYGVSECRSRPMAIADAMRAALSHCHQCRDRDGNAMRAVRLLPKQLVCRNATCVPAPLTRCVAAIHINGVGISLRAPRSIQRIHLTRTNVVKHALSQLDLWQNHNTEEHTPSARAPKRVNITSLLDAIAQTTRMRKLTSRYLIGTVHVITYEGLQINPQAEVDAVFRALRMRAPPPVPLDGRVLKTTSDDLRTSVVNFDEVAAALLAERGRCYHEMWTTAVPLVFNLSAMSASDARTACHFDS